MQEILKKNPIMPVLVLRDLNDAFLIVEALVIGGIESVEVTLRTEIALDAITALREKFPKLIVGAGTLLTVDQILKAKAAGAQFGVSPGLSKPLCALSKEMNFPYLPGVITPSEIMQAREMDHGCLKFFPAEYAGGIEALRAFNAVFPEVVFCPTGGVNRSNFKEYLALDNVAAVGGSWLVTCQAIKEKNWGAMTLAVKKCLASL